MRGWYREGQPWMSHGSWLARIHLWSDQHELWLGCMWWFCSHGRNVNWVKVNENDDVLEIWWSVFMHNICTFDMCFKIPLAHFDETRAWTFGLFTLTPIWPYGLGLNSWHPSLTVPTDFHWVVVWPNVTKIPSPSSQKLMQETFIEFEALGFGRHPESSLPTPAAKRTPSCRCIVKFIWIDFP